MHVDQYAMRGPRDHTVATPVLKRSVALIQTWVWCAWWTFNDAMIILPLLHGSSVGS
jgi:hypothetical protein